MRLEVSGGSRSQGASMREASLEVWVAPMVGAPGRSWRRCSWFREVQAEADSGAVETYQSEGLVGSMATCRLRRRRAAARLRISRRRWLSGAVCAETDDQCSGIGGMLGEADDLGERPPEAELRLSKCCASSREQGAGLIDAVGGAPEAAVVAEVEERLRAEW